MLFNWRLSPSRISAFNSCNQRENPESAFQTSAYTDFIPGIRWSTTGSCIIFASSATFILEPRGSSWIIPDGWTTDCFSRDVRIRYWGGVARNRICLVGIHRQYKVRICQECGELLRTYKGADDTIGNYVRYIQDNPILAMAEHFEQVKTVYLRFKDDLKSEGMTLSDFSSLIPFAVSTLELGLPSGCDLVMDRPFQEPDEFFLRRQREAIGGSRSDGMVNVSFCRIARPRSMPSATHQ